MMRLIRLRRRNAAAVIATSLVILLVVAANLDLVDVGSPRPATPTVHDVDTARNLRLSWERSVNTRGMGDVMNCERKTTSPCWTYRCNVTKEQWLISVGTGRIAVVAFQNRRISFLYHGKSFLYLKSVSRRYTAATEYTSKMAAR